MTEFGGLAGMSGRSSGSEGISHLGSSGVSDTTRNLEERLERLLLVNVALWSLLQEKTGLSEADLMQRVKLLDEMDGKADGRATRAKVAPCHACGRPVPARRDKCPYCGAAQRRGSAFDAV